MQLLVLYRMVLAGHYSQRKHPTLQLEMKQMLMGHATRIHNHLPIQCDNKHLYGCGPVCKQCYKHSHQSMRL
jgi:hypothetical protein